MSSSLRFDIALFLCFNTSSPLCFDSFDTALLLHYNTALPLCFNGFDTVLLLHYNIALLLRFNTSSPLCFDSFDTALLLHYNTALLLRFNPHLSATTWLAYPSVAVLLRDHHLLWSCPLALLFFMNFFFFLFTFQVCTRSSFSS